PGGGTAGQVLAKASGDDFDTEWTDQTSGGADLTSYDQVSELPDYPDAFPPDLTGVTASDVGALPATTVIPAVPADIGAQPAGDYVADTDPRLSNARTPTAHTHAQSDVTGLTAALAGKQDAGDYASGAQGAKADTAV